MFQTVSLIRSADLGSTVGAGDYAAQAGKALENLSLALKAAGAQIEDVLSTRVLVASSQQSDLVEAWTVVRDAFEEHDVPSTRMGVDPGTSRRP